MKGGICAVVSVKRELCCARGKVGIELVSGMAIGADGFPVNYCIF